MAVEPRVSVRSGTQTITNKRKTTHTLPNSPAFKLREAVVSYDKQVQVCDRIKLWRWCTCASARLGWGGVRGVS